jgi:predicted nucleotidyltransferase
MKILEDYLLELKSNELVEVVILFGSCARGENRPDSDIDLIIICNETRRDVLTRDGQIFEIVYVTENDAIDYYSKNKDEAVRLWKDAQILFDRNGAAERIKSYVQDEITSKGKEKLSGTALEQAKFGLTDSLKVFRRDVDTDFIKISYLLHRGVERVLELHFLLNGLWMPAPKKMMDTIKESDERLYLFTSKFYGTADVDSKIDLFSEMITLLFPE